ncbi:GTPase [Promethearchaeum syntrophicum]|uniref:GTPase n=1 Tax=Promethearchaeum syntrophicum TaxID=2594042 RepID=A0A5B9D9I8_9ARCH|nr:GTPase [Candidatus Prometheoarchaeum syntrophicum]QEE15859.1 GTPase YlqF [Candidatus Prometheoarchaeum syntrophicum]
MKTEQHWQDVFKAVLKDTDVVLEILDARNPLGTHNHAIEKFMQQNKPQMKLILVLNKKDLVPKEIFNAWVNYFKQQNYEIFSTCAKFHSGTMFLFHRLRDLGKSGNENILIVGYPNTGKSSLIQALTKNKKKVGISSSAGFTRAIKRIKLTNNLYLIDTPGVIPIDETDETAIALKACMVADKVKDPLAVVEALYDLLPVKMFEKLYKIGIYAKNSNLEESDSLDELIERIGKKHGPLRAGGKINENEVYKRIIRDWQLNKLHYFNYPPGYNEEYDEAQIKVVKKVQKSQIGIPTSLKRTKKEKS